MRITTNSGQRSRRRLLWSAALLGLLAVMALPSGSALAAPHRDKFNTPVEGVSVQHLIPAAGKREVISFGTSANLTQLWIAGACDACPVDDAIAVTVGIASPSDVFTNLRSWTVNLPVTRWQGIQSGAQQSIPIPPGIHFSASDVVTVSFCELRAGACATNSNFQLGTTRQQFTGGTLYDAGTHSQVGPATDLVFTSWVGDPTPPSVILSQTPDQTTRSTTATFQFSATDPDDTDGFSFQCALDQASFTPCVSGVTYDNIAVDKHTFTVHAADTSFNTGADTSYTWNVSGPTPPVTQAVLSPAPNAAGWNNTNLNVSLNASAAPGTQIGNTYFSVNSSVCLPAQVFFCSVYSGGITINTDGQYIIQYFSVNDLGDFEQPHIVVVKVDRTPLHVPQIMTRDVTTGGATITWTTDKPASSRVDYGTTTDLGSTTALDATLVTDHSVQLSGLQPNTTYYYRVRSVDIAGNTPFLDPPLTVFTTLPKLATPGSAQFNGTSGYAESAAAPDLNLTGDWTLETWFKDESPLGFNHDYVTLVNKGDRNANPEEPYVISLGYKRLTAGLRSAWTDQLVSYDLYANGVDPKAWHHVAATFEASSRTLTLYLDGSPVAHGTLATNSAGNSLPVEIGRNGPVSGKYWRGKLDDVRIWSVARSAAEVQANYRSQVSGPQTGLVADWRLDETSGTVLTDSTGNNHTAMLHGGATLSTDVHP